MHYSNDHQGRSASDQNELNKLHVRLARLESQPILPPPSLVAPDQDLVVASLFYTDLDIALFQQNFDRLNECLQDGRFIQLAIDLAQLQNHDEMAICYQAMYDYCRQTWPDRVIHMVNMDNSLVFHSQQKMNKDMYDWNVGSRPEITMALLAQAVLTPRPSGYPFLDQLFQSGFGYAKRRQFLQPWSTDFSEYHYVSALRTLQQTSPQFFVVSEVPQN